MASSSDFSTTYPYVLNKWNQEKLMVYMRKSKGKRKEGQLAPVIYADLALLDFIQYTCNKKGDQYGFAPISRDYILMNLPTLGINERQLSDRLHNLCAWRLLERKQETPENRGKEAQYRVTGGYKQLLKKATNEEAAQKIYSPDDILYKAVKRFGKILNKKTGLQPPDEKTLQKWAAELEACAEENRVPFDTIADQLYFAQHDKFWCGTLHDVSAFRKQYRKIITSFASKY